jgi:ABC-2 type transport system ATP-binding protein
VSVAQARPEPEGTPAIRVRALVKRFGAFTAVNGLDLEVPRGQCCGILGPNGAGKTTTIEMLEGLQEPTSGELEVLGRSWRRDAEALRGLIGVQLQETRFFGHLTVKETLELFHSFTPDSAMTVGQALDLVHLGPKAGTQVAGLSGGQRQRLALATALMHGPQLVFLDEPTTGLDPQARASVWDVIRSLKAQGRTVLLTTHYMEEAEQLCDRVFIFDHGKIIAEGSPRELVERHGGQASIRLHTEPELPAEVLSASPGVLSVAREGEGWFLGVQDPQRTVPAVLTVAAERRVAIRSLVTSQPTMNDVFLALTGRSIRGEDAPKPAED